MPSSTAVWPASPLLRDTLFRRRTRKSSGRWSSCPEAVADTDERRLFLLALRARAFLEPVWLEWHTANGGDIPSPLSRSTCGRSSLFLKRILHAEFPGLTPRAWFGFHAGHDWQSHAWVEAGEYLIDLTADQFGDEPVIVAPRPDPRYQKGVCDSAYPEFARAHRRSVERLWQRWQRWSRGVGPRQPYALTDY